jgi:hypothetical protein
MKLKLLPLGLICSLSILSFSANANADSVGRCLGNQKNGIVKIKTRNGYYGSKIWEMYVEEGKTVRLIDLTLTYVDKKGVKKWYLPADRFSRNLTTNVGESRKSITIGEDGISFPVFPSDTKGAWSATIAGKKFEESKCPANIEF